MAPRLRVNLYIIQRGHGHQLVHQLFHQRGWEVRQPRPLWVFTLTLLGEPDGFSKLEKLGLTMVSFLLGKFEPFLLSCECDVDSR